MGVEGVSSRVSSWEISPFWYPKYATDEIRKHK